MSHASGHSPTSSQAWPGDFGEVLGRQGPGAEPKIVIIWNPLLESWGRMGVRGKEGWFPPSSEDMGRHSRKHIRLLEMSETGCHRGSENKAQCGDELGDIGANLSYSMPPSFTQLVMMDSFRLPGSSRACRRHSRDSRGDDRPTWSPTLNHKGVYTWGLQRSWRNQLEWIRRVM